MNFKQIKMIYLKTIFKSQILFTSFSLLVQNFKLQLFFFGSNQKKKKKKIISFQQNKNSCSL